MAATHSYTYYRTTNDVPNYNSSGWGNQRTGNARINYWDSRSSLKFTGGTFSNENYNGNTKNGAAINYSYNNLQTIRRIFVYNTLFQNNIIYDNNFTIDDPDTGEGSSLYGSGIIYVQNAKHAEIVNCTFTGNSVTRDGSAICILQTNAGSTNSTLIKDSTFTNNVGSAGAVYITGMATVSNCEFSGNIGNGMSEHLGNGAGAIYSASPRFWTSGTRANLLIEGCRFLTETDGIYLNNCNASLKDLVISSSERKKNYSVANLIAGRNYSLTIKENSTLQFAGRKITAKIGGEANSTLEFINKAPYAYEVEVVRDGEGGGDFVGIRNLVFSGTEPIRFDGEDDANGDNKLDGNVRDAESLTINVNKLGTSDWDPYTVATGIVFEPPGNPHNPDVSPNGKFIDLKIVVDNRTIAATTGVPGAPAVPFQSALLVDPDEDINGPDYTYVFTHTTNGNTYNYGLLYHDTDLILAEILNGTELYVNSWYENIYTNKINYLVGELTGPYLQNLTGLIQNQNLIGVNEFDYLTKDGGTFTSIPDAPFTGTRYRSVNKANEDLAGTNVYVTGGTFSGDQYGYGANLVVCDDQRVGIAAAKEIATNKIIRVHCDPNRKLDLETVKTVPGIGDVVTNGKSIINGGFLFGGDNLTVSSGALGLGTRSRSVNIYAGLEGKGVFTGDRITVNASGGSMILQNTKLEVKASVAGYAASKVATSPEGTISYLMGGSYISGGSKAQEYTMSLNHGSDVTIGDSADDLSVSLYACAGSLVGGGYDGKKLLVTLTGAPSLSISSGTYEYLVAGGHLLQGDQSKLHHIGNTSLTIDGGTFKGNIYGGNISRRLQEATSDRLKMTGDTNILIKVDGTRNVNITGHADKEPGRYGNIFGGSNGEGSVIGKTSITFEGDGNLDRANSLTFTGAISGDSSGAGWFNKGEGLKHYKFVTEDRSLTFKDFDGNFNTNQIVNIDTITFTGKTKMKFTDTGLNLNDIGMWKFNYSNEAETVAGVANLATLDCSGVSSGINFDGDKLAIGGSWQDWVVGKTWTLINAKADGLTGIFNAVSLFGKPAESSGNDKWIATVGPEGATRTVTLELKRSIGDMTLTMSNS